MSFSLITLWFIYIKGEVWDKKNHFSKKYHRLNHVVYQGFPSEEHSRCPFACCLELQWLLLFSWVIISRWFIWCCLNLVITYSIINASPRGYSCGWLDGTANRAQGGFVFGGPGSPRKNWVTTQTSDRMPRKSEISFLGVISGKFTLYLKYRNSNSHFIFF